MSFRVVSKSWVAVRKLDILRAKYTCLGAAQQQQATAAPAEEFVRPPANRYLRRSTSSSQTEPKVNAPGQNNFLVRLRAGQPINYSTCAHTHDTLSNANTNFRASPQATDSHLPWLPPGVSRALLVEYAHVHQFAQRLAHFPQRHRTDKLLPPSSHQRSASHSPKNNETFYRLQ